MFMMISDSITARVSGSVVVALIAVRSRTMPRFMVLDVGPTSVAIWKLAELMSFSRICPCSLSITGRMSSTGCTLPSLAMPRMVRPF